MPTPDTPDRDTVDDTAADTVADTVADASAQSRRRGRRRQPDEREREVISWLATLRDERPSVPNDMVDEILAYVYSQPEAQRRVSLRWFVAATVVAVAATAGLAAALLVARRHRELAVAAAGASPSPGTGALVTARSILHLRPEIRSTVGAPGRRGLPRA